MKDDQGDKVEEGTQIHPGTIITLTIYMNIPQNNKYQGISGSGWLDLGIIQWTDPCEPDTEYITLKATKIICESVNCLPEWGRYQNNPPMITEQVINDFLADNPGCYVDPDWEFEYGFDLSDPITNYNDIPSQYGYGGSGWNTFTQTTFITLDSIPDNANIICIREVLEEGYIPFKGQTPNPGDGSAELYAHTDGYNFDNLEWIYINTIESGGTYYIVGFNVPIEEDCEEIIDLTKKVWDETSEEWVDSINVLTGDILTFNITISTPDDACITCNGNITDRIPYGNHQLGFSYVDDTTNIMMVFSDGTVENWQIEPLKVDLPNHVVGLIWNETNMGDPMVLQPGMNLYFTYDVEVKALPATGAFTFTATISATYDCIEEPVIKASDSAQVFVVSSVEKIEIWTIDDLYAIRNNLTGSYILMNDLDFEDEDDYIDDGVGANAKMIENTTGDGWLPIGNDWESRFQGNFDGDNHAISNLFIDRNTNDVGLFGYLGCWNKLWRHDNIMLQLRSPQWNKKCWWACRSKPRYGYKKPCKCIYHRRRPSRRACRFQLWWWYNSWHNIKILCNRGNHWR